MFYNIITHSWVCIYPASNGYFILMLIIIGAAWESLSCGWSGKWRWRWNKWCVVDRKNTWIGSFQFTITEGCLPLSYTAAIIEVETHSWETCSFYLLIRKTRQVFIENSKWAPHHIAPTDTDNLDLHYPHTCSNTSWCCLCHSFLIKSDSNT